MNKKLSQYESTYQKMKELSAKLGNSDQGNGKHKPKPMCWKCHQARIHPRGKEQCLWKNLTDEEAKAKALD
jgi:hypothetical protein